MNSSTRRWFLRCTAAASLVSAMNMVPATKTVLAGGDSGCCVHCGCRAARCRKVCRLVREDRKITTTCWGLQCEDVCVPGPSTPDCKHCDTVNPKGSEDKNLCAQPKRIVWTSWIPGCGPELVTKRKLMKKTVTKSVPSFRWVVETVCPECVASIDPVKVPHGTQIPAAPRHDGVEILTSLVSRELPDSH